MIAKALLKWYDAHARVLPWRDTGDPYATWVSEIMLQQTRVETVLRYFPAFMEAFPTVEALAAAGEKEVMKRWEGLGYYRRAANLHRGAKQVTEEMNGILPRTAEELKKITGIGDYTAGAIASMAFGEQTPAVDGNVIRVLSRLKGFREEADTPAGKRYITAEAAALVPKERPGDFNQALMDLGSGICTPGTPDCDECPLCRFCEAAEEGDAASLPVLTQKKPPRALDYDVTLVMRGNAVLVRKRTETLLKDLYVFVMTEGYHDGAQLGREICMETGVTVGETASVTAADHVFTHRIWRMRIHRAAWTGGEPENGYFFAAPEELAQLTIPSAMRAALKAYRELPL